MGKKYILVEDPGDPEPSFWIKLIGFVIIVVVVCCSMN
jgi:hypothetical protein